MSLPVHKRRKSNSGERVSCQLPDGTLCSLPSWMLNPECAHFSFGAPLVSVEALCELRHLLAAWQAPANCGNALLKPPAKEGEDETTSEATRHADEPAASPCARDSGSRPQAKGTDAYAHGATNQRSPLKQHR